MSPRVTQPEFRDQQRFSKYPFADHATLISDDGLLFPDPMIVDASLYLVGASENIRITQIEVAPRLITFYIGDDLEPEMAKASFDPLQPPEILYFEDTYSRSAGIMVLDLPTISSVNTWGEGIHTFSPDATPFLAGIVIPLPEVVLRGFLLPDGSLMTGHVPILGKDGVIVRQDDDGNIRIDIVGDPLFTRKICGEFDQILNSPIFLKTINGLLPDPYGNFHLSTADPALDEALRVFPAGKDTIVISIAGNTLK